jgi:hypothetical protein
MMVFHHSLEHLGYEFQLDSPLGLRVLLEYYTLFDGSIEIRENSIKYFRRYIYNLLLSVIDVVDLQSFVQLEYHLRKTRKRLLVKIKNELFNITVKFLLK